MQEYMVAAEDFFVIARILHVIGVVLWIGGVAFLALVLVPTLRTMPEPEKSFKFFAAVEGGFKRQAKIVTAVTGLSGFFMLFWLNAWDRYLDLSFWWVHLMTFIWVFFTLVLFVIEPVLIRRNIHEKAMRDPAATFKFANRMLKVLTALSLIAILGAIAGVHG
jgi:uncharacterized membrane protein